MQKPKQCSEQETTAKGVYERGWDNDILRRKVSLPPQGHSSPTRGDLCPLFLFWLAVAKGEWAEWWPPKDLFTS